MLTLPSARVENIFPAIPTMCRICRPTRDKMAISLETVIWSAKESRISELSSAV